jgi:hypothetical protein
MTKVLNRGLKAYGEVRAQGLGFIAGEKVGGAVTQATNKSTAVTLNKMCGTVTMNGAALAAAAEVAHTVNNSLVLAGDVVVVSIRSGATAGAYVITVDAVANGSFRVALGNQSAGSLSEAVVYNYAIIRASNN